jgi:hypothetical protein
MREVDMTRLSTPFAAGLDREIATRDALRVDAASWRQLTDLIFADLATGPPYGIRWWAPHPGTSRRILISDQLVSCAASVHDNLAEAALHYLEFLDARDRVDSLYADVVQFRHGQPTITMAPLRSPWDSLAHDVVRLHQVGVARALSGALDCVAGTVIGVAGLPQRILRADFAGLRRWHRQRRDVPASEGEQRQRTLGDRIEALIQGAGPAGWVDWLDGFRNMLVHRGRRLEIGQFVPRGPILFGPDDRPAPRTRSITHLPIDPGRSDVEVFLDPQVSSVLTEDAKQTLAGTVLSTLRLIEGIGAQLIELWVWRKDHPDALTQPRAQWPDGAATESTGFAGYAPGSYPYSPQQFTANPANVTRLRAAALDDAARDQWGTFD